MGQRGVRLIGGAIGLVLAASCADSGGGQRWHLVAGVPYAQDKVGLTVVAAAAADRIWVAGEQENLRWDGRRWHHHDGPPDPIQAASPATPGHPLYVVAGGQLWYTRSTSWTKVDAPAAGGGAPTLTAIAASGDGAWAVGSTSAHESGPPYVLHWDGTKASSIPVPGSGSLRAVTAVRPDDVWVLGAHYSDYHGWIDPFLLHWDGRSWTTTAVLGVQEAQPGGLFAAAGSGWLYGRGKAGKPLLFRLDGTPSRVDLPRAADGWDPEAGVDDGRGGLWLTGYTSGEDFPKAEYFHRSWYGSWTVTPAPEDPRGRDDEAYGGGEIHGMALVPGSGTIWAVGAKGSNEEEYQYYPLVQTLGG